MAKVTLFTVVWGQMNSWWLDGCLNSLLQADNLPGCLDNVESYIVYTNSELALKGHATCGKKLMSTGVVQFRKLPRGENNVNACTTEVLQHCASKGTYAHIISPDHIYGNGSLGHMVQLCKEDKADIIAYGFPRINFAAFGGICDRMKGTAEAQARVWTNRELVEISMRNLHWETTNPGGGVTITQTSPTSWKVRHAVPTITIKPLPTALEYMQNNPTQNSGYDHILPLKCIQQGASYYYIPDSDQFFLTEPTDRGQALCSETARPESFMSDGEANKNFWDNFEQVWHTA